jgi:hypothetical protein
METLSQYAEMVKDNLISNYGRNSTTDGDIINLITTGADWQYKKDVEVIQELLKAIKNNYNYIELTSETISAITKAENHISTNK